MVLDVLARTPALRRLEWVGILAPLAFLVVYHYMMVGPGHGLLHSIWGLGVLITLFGLLTTVFSRLIFRVVARSQRNLEEMSRIASAQNAQLRALNEANLALAQERLVSSVLQRVVDLSRELVQARYGALSVAGEDGQIKVLLTSGIDETSRQGIGTLPSGKGLLGLMLRRTEPLRLDTIADHPAAVGFPPRHPPMSTFLGVPIRHDGEVVGSLYLTEKVRGPFTAEDEEVAQLFANQAAIAIQNARLYERLQALAVETERSRISREMHDGLAQVLGYVNIKAQAVEAFLAKKDYPAAEEQVRELSQAARKVYQDVREGILALRAQVGPGSNLQDVLEQYVSEYQRQLGCPVTVRWNVQPVDVDLSPLREVQILRIVQEALTNVRKHAAATQVDINLGSHNDDLDLEVLDNGKGFNPLAIRREERPHLGLQTMQERAESIGGIFRVESAPGKGTMVRVIIPRVIHRRTARGVP